MTSKVRAVLAVGLCVSQVGCSLTFTTTVPDNPTQLRYFDCTSTPGLAVADAVFALTSGAQAVAVFQESEMEYAEKNDGASRNLVGGLSVGLAALSVASGIYGIIHAERCRHAKAELRERLLAPERQPEGLTPTVTPVPPSGTQVNPPPPAQPPATPAPEPPASPPPAATPTSSGGLILPAPAPAPAPAPPNP